MTATEDI